MVKRLLYWVLDYVYVGKQVVKRAWSRDTPESYRRSAAPVVILLPGVYESGGFMQPVARLLYSEGYDVHIIDTLGYNRGSIEEEAVLVQEYIKRSQLTDVSIVAHSKGGLIGKLLMSYTINQQTIRTLIAISTPFLGSKYAHLLPLKSLKEFIPKSVLLTRLTSLVVPDKHIVSIYGIFDPHIPEGSMLIGAKNIQINTAYGHFKILENKAVLTEIVNNLK
jgi:triacylglycerol lipase